jgi:hypothetical protein
MERISGTIIEIQRRWDRQADHSPVYVLDAEGREEIAVDYSQRRLDLQVGEPATFIGRRAASGELSIHAYER